MAKHFLDTEESEGPIPSLPIKTKYAVHGIFCFNDIINIEPLNEMRYNYMTMARKLDRGKAINLRKQGGTYTFIRKQLNVSKSTLSYWLRDIELTPDQLNKIKKETIAKRVETYIQTTRERRKRIIQECYESEKKNLSHITKRDFLIAGLFLYLGEGEKSNWFVSSISNSNPSIIKFAVFWLVKILGVNKKKIKVRLHLYQDMSIQKEIKFWQKVTGLPIIQFSKPYIKKSKFTKINYSTFGHGTCNIIVGNVKLKHKIMTAIQVILDSAGANKGV